MRQSIGKLLIVTILLSPLPAIAQGGGGEGVAVVAVDLLAAPRVEERQAALRQLAHLAPVPARRQAQDLLALAAQR